MKMSPQRYNEIKEGIRLVVDQFGPQRVRDALATQSQESVLWSLLNSAVFDWIYDDQHPAYQKGRVRILPFKDRRWDLYADDVHDSHISTALKRIAKELGLTPAKGSKELEMAQKTGKVTSKRYKCKECGHESIHSTNHYGEFYDRCPKCSWKSPMSAIKVHECLDPLPEGWEKPEPWKMLTLGEVLQVEIVEAWDAIALMTTAELVAYRQVLLNGPQTTVAKQHMEIVVELLTERGVRLN